MERITSRKKITGSHLLRGRTGADGFLKHRIRLALVFLFFLQLLSTTAYAVQIGDRVQATDTLNVRSCYFLTCSSLGTVSSGSTGTIVNGSYTGDGYTWWYISWDNGLIGYSVENWLAVLQSLPGDFTLSNDPPVCDTDPPEPSPAVRINWTTSSNAASYDVYRNGSLYSSGITGTSFYNNANVVAGQSYSYFVQARNSAGTRDSNTVSISIPSNICDSAIVPVSPTGLAALASNGIVSLAWNDNSNNETGFKIERKAGASGNWSQLATLGQGIAAYLDYGVTAGTTYYYRIYAYNTAGNSGYSNEASATLPAPVTSPTATTGTCQVNGSDSALLFGTVNPNGAPTTAWFQWGTSSAYGNVTTTENIGNGSSVVQVTHQISGLLPDTTYNFRIVGQNSAGTSYGTNLTCRTPPPAVIPPTATTSPATSVDTSSATLNGTINPNGAPVTGWFEWGTSTAYGNSTSLLSGGSGASPVPMNVSISGLAPDTTYYFRAAGRNSAGTSYGDAQNFTTASISVTDPLLEVTPTSLDFGTVRVGSSGDLNFSINNTGGGTLVGSISASGPYSVVTGTIFNVAGGQSQTVVVRFNPTSVGINEGTVAVISNAGYTLLSVSGTGVVTNTDSDGDGLPDEYESANGLDPNDPSDALADQDGDGLTNLQEFQGGTNPRRADTDGDGVDDKFEVSSGTDPLDATSHPPKPLYPGGALSVAATNLSEQPELNGETLLSEITPFFGDDGSGNALFTGSLRLEIVREDSAGNLNFYYRVTNDSSSNTGISKIRLSNFAGFDTYAYYRDDGYGRSVPSRATRSADGAAIIFEFSDPIAPGEQSRLLLIKTNANGYTEGKAMLFGIGFGAVASYGATERERPLLFDKLTKMLPRQECNEQSLPANVNGAKNLVFITHGWNSDGNTWVTELKDLIEDKSGNEWQVIAFDWSEYAGTGWALYPLTYSGDEPQGAYINAGTIGDCVGYLLALRGGYEKIHFIAHSAGSNLIEHAAKWVKNVSSPRSVIYSTFLDPYYPYPTKIVTSDGTTRKIAPYGRNADFSEAYVDMRPMITDVNIPTDLYLPNAANFIVDKFDNIFTDLIPSPFDLLRKHSWPHIFYRELVRYNSFSDYGFPVPSFIDPKFDLAVFSVADPIDLSTALTTPQTTIQTILSDTGTVDRSIPYVFTMYSGSPVWMSQLIEVTEPINFLQFNYAFNSDAEGVLSVFFDGQLIYRVDERYTMDTLNSTGSISLGEILPGQHTLSLRLDPFTEEQSIVEISNVQTGIIKQVAVSAVENTASDSGGSETSDSAGNASSGGGSGGGGCSIRRQDSSIDPVLPLLMIWSLFFLIRRRHSRK